MKFICRLSLFLACLSLSAQALSTSPSYYPACVDATSDTDGDGWGWENGLSCIVSTPPSAQCIDTDGDGWGWDGVQSCQVCVDSDPIGDGWGWNGVDSCPLERTLPTVCVDTDPVGDTWGWDGVGACRIAPILVPGGDTSAIAGLWLLNEPDELPYTDYMAIDSSGGISNYYIETTGCYLELEDDPGYQVQIYPLGGDQYEIRTVEVYFGEIYDETQLYTIFVNSSGGLTIKYVEDDYNGSTDVEVDLPSAGFQLSSFDLCN